MGTAPTTATGTSVRQGGAAALLGLAWLSCAAAEPLAHTYSIVARDPATGQLGGAVHSHWIAVGSHCLWGEAGVGVVLTQAMTRPAYGAEGLRRLAAGEAPAAALAAMQAGDPRPDARQVAILDAQGRVAAFTGEHTIPVAGHLEGEGFAVQANLMANDRVVPAMALAFRESEGPLAHRLLIALEAAQAAGGDARGQQAAALLVVAGSPSGDPFRDRLVDLRVDDHPEAVAELRRIYRKREAVDAWQHATAALRAGHLAEAEVRFRRVEAAYPDDLEARFWYALSLAQEGHVAQARPRMQAVLAASPGWRQVLRDLPGTSALPDADVGRALVEALLAP